MANVQKTQVATSRPRTIKASAPTANTAPTSEAIAARAYEIWQANGCPEGCEQEHWFQAEAELVARASQ